MQWNKQNNKNNSSTSEQYGNDNDEQMLSTSNHEDEEEQDSSASKTTQPIQATIKQQIKSKTWKIGRQKLVSQTNTEPDMEHGLSERKGVKKVGSMKEPQNSDKGQR